MINNTQSQKLYNLLINGKMVNKRQYESKSNELEENPLYNELFTHLDEYSLLYQRIGYALVHKERSFFFIRELAGEESNEAAIKVQALFIIIGRYMTEKGYLFEVLSDYRAGLAPENLAMISAEERYLDILQTCKLCKSRTVEEELDNHLVNRGLMFKNSRGNYVLSEAGLGFFNELTEAYTEVIEG